MKTKQRDMFQAGAQAKETIDTLTIGVVVDTNDPQQMGRVRVVCPQWGDTYSTPVENLPWASYVSPFGGQVSIGTRGPGIDTSEGGISYGMWAIPKIGAQVIVMCVDGDPMLRVYMGCIFDQLTPHTLPHGRYMYEPSPGLNNTGSAPTPQGPFTSREHTVEPLTTNLKQAFGGKGDPNYEWRSRAADYTVAAIDVTQLNQTYSSVPDDKDIAYEDWCSTQGYAPSRIDPNSPSSYTDRNYDSSVYCWVSPGFHAISMDDRQENCRMRFRTTSGHQILLDDTNERIYIATAKGNNWVEMDQAGNIDVFSSNKVNIRSKQDINFTADGTIRMYAGVGIHMFSAGEIRTEATTDMHIKSLQNIRTHAAQNLYLQSDKEIDILAGSNLNLTSSALTSINAGSDINLTASGVASIGAGGAVILAGASVSLEGSPAPVAATATAASELPAFYTNRIPDHEPWGRCMTLNNSTLAPEFSYTNSQMNRSERGVPIIRGMFWRR